MYRRAASGDDAELFDRHRQELLQEQPRPPPQHRLFQGREPQSLAAMRRLKNAPPPQVLEGKRKRHASTWLAEFVKVVLLPSIPTNSVRSVRMMIISLAELSVHGPIAEA